MWQFIVTGFLSDGAKKGIAAPTTVTNAARINIPPPRRETLFNGIFLSMLTSYGATKDTALVDLDGALIRSSW